jgi:hypothetical protein
MTSGAIQCGVPMKVLRLVMVLVSCSGHDNDVSAQDHEHEGMMLF